MKRVFSAILVTMMVLCCSSMIAFGEPTGNSLDDVVNGNSSSQSQTSSGNTQTEKKTEEKTDREKKNDNFIAGLNEASDLTGEVDGVSEVTSGIKLVASWIVQVLSYGLTVLLAVRIMLDLVYIGLPFSRNILGNGFQGNAQAGAGGIPNSAVGGGMQGGMGGMGMGGMGRMGGMQGGMGRMGGMGGMGGMGMGGMQGGMQGGMEQQNATGRVQWVSNAALNCIAGESQVGPDGRAVSPFKMYIKDMVVVLVLVPILITLAVTGTLTNLGFLIGDLLVDAIAGIGDMI